MASIIIPKERPRRSLTGGRGQFARLHREAHQRIKQLSAASGWPITELLSFAVSHLRVRRVRKSAAN